MSIGEESKWSGISGLILIENDHLAGGNAVYWRF